MVRIKGRRRLRLWRRLRRGQGCEVTAREHIVVNNRRLAGWGEDAELEVQPGATHRGLLASHGLRDQHMHEDALWGRNLVVRGGGGFEGVGLNGEREGLGVHTHTTHHTTSPFFRMARH